MLLCSCSGQGLENSGPVDGGMPEAAEVFLDLSQPQQAPPDLTMPTVVVDLASPPQDQYVPPTDAIGIACGTQTCTTGNLCCVMLVGGQPTAACAPSCPDAAIPVACDGPGNCGGNPCCVQVQNRMIEGAMCTSSPSDCAPSLGAIAGGSGVDRLCHTDGDCTYGLQSAQLPNCCSVTQNGAKIHFCFDKAFVGVAPGITCP